MKKYLFIILFYGIFWGLLEFVLGGYLDYINHPIKDILLRLIGFIVLGICLYRKKSPLSLIGVGIIAASFKIFNVFTCNLALLSPGIIRPIISILIQTTVVAIISFTVIKINLALKRRVIFEKSENKIKTNHK